MASYRHLARTCVMQTIFELDMAAEIVQSFSSSPAMAGPTQKKRSPKVTTKSFKASLKRLPKDVLDSILKDFAPKLTEKEFAYKTLKGVLDHKKEIVKIIEKYAPEWPIEKIAPVDRAILKIGVYEIVFSKDIPPVVAINEAVEIAKHFGDNNSQKFVNGVLSSVMKNYNERL
ncbi:MAG: transcription antitermination factor NusB [Patescibacteria group bacterium]